MTNHSLPTTIHIRATTGEDLPWLQQHLLQEWGGEPAITCTGRYSPTQLPGFVAVLADNGHQIVGEVTYRMEDHVCEIITLSSLRERAGIGSALFSEVEKTARTEGCRTMQLTTTTDNLRALAFYQKRGMRIVQVFPDALDEVRRVKPHIGKIGMNGIPLQDALLLEKRLR